jgi:hypothetical protein
VGVESLELVMTWSWVMTALLAQGRLHERGQYGQNPKIIGGINNGDGFVGLLDDGQLSRYFSVLHLTIQDAFKPTIFSKFM